MAIYHLTAKTGTRSNGQSAKAKDEYIEREGKYSGIKGQKKDDVLCVMSGNMPEWDGGHREYWKAADKYERANGRLYKEIEFALPKELTQEEMQKAAHGFAESLTSKERLPYTLAIHVNDPNNPHCHLMISERANDGIPRPPDVWFSRANPEHPERGGAKKSTSLMPKEWLIETRAAWEKTANEALERAGSAERVDRRTLAAQGIGREPGAHRGLHRSARERHAEASRLEGEIAEARLELAAAAKEEAEAAHRREAEKKAAIAEGRAAARAGYEAWKQAKAEKQEQERAAKREEERRAERERERRRENDRGRGGFSR